jgi:lipopolysaccharide transport system ATP-binding protein
VTGEVKVIGLGKRFFRRRSGRSRTLKELLLLGWRDTSAIDEFWALRHVNFSVQAGEMLGVIGGNGSGKSTLLRLLGGVMRPDEGEVAVRGRVNGLLELNAGTHPDLTGRDNIFINSIIAGLTRQEAETRFDRIVDFAELEELSTVLCALTALA